MPSAFPVIRKNLATFEYLMTRPVPEKQLNHIDGVTPPGPRTNLQCTDSVAFSFMRLKPPLSRRVPLSEEDEEMIQRRIENDMEGKFEAS
ncbi:uncharacterized protein CLUP02_03567 [Colletotrichum lupini]|uniref:Uncharacterized protein n=1 Tax=Colletotrichum lupini TaxID=145971 RepID=A0A9Q8SJ45_9PEZI|nr:uncharacterized protein CLUP02_03567 [Colletotrichum lupini]UQC78093.1 hypothetical protein CLUP02_03567 [Colletotrichum lupini]